MTDNLGGTNLWEMLGAMLSSDHRSVVSINLFVALLCACIVIGHLVEESPWMNESITALAVGLCTGVVILLTTGGKSSHLLVFSEDFFFIYLLPPIIFNAGFKVKKKQFFRNFMTIMLFGAIGTLISTAIISIGAMHFFKKMNISSLRIGDYLAIGAIFSATDSVCTLQVLNQDETPLLYSLVFGEGVVNDATSVVLFHAIQSFDLSHINSSIAVEFIGNFLYLFISSTILGVLTGLLSAYIIKKLYFGRHSTDREVALMILMAYLSYMLAELFYLSAILTVFFCGIVMSHYTWHNVTESSRITTKHAFATWSFVAEIFIFLYVGMDALDIEKWKVVSDSPGTSVRVSSILLGLILVGRAAFVFPLSFLSNLTKNSLHVKIDIKQQVTIWWAGLMRGAVSMALAYNQCKAVTVPATGQQYTKTSSKNSQLDTIIRISPRRFEVDFNRPMFTRSGHTHLHGNAIMITSTITVVLFSTVVFGLMTKPLVRILLPSQKHSASMLSSEPSSPKSFAVPLLNGQNSEDNQACHNVPRPTSFRMLLSTPSHTVHQYWRKFDNGFMRPVFGGRGFVPFVPCSPTDQSVHQWQ